MKYTHIRADGRIEEVKPSGKSFTLAELQGFVGGIIEIVPLGHGKELYVNEEGKLTGLPVNAKATEIWKKAYPIAEYPENNDELVVGDVLIAEREYKKR